MDTRNLTLLTDLYELTMMQGYFNEKCKDVAIFDAFFRTIPCGNGYAVCAGLEQVIDYIKNLSFHDDDLAYLKSTGLFSSDFLNYLRDFRFSGDIYALPEGSLMFPYEPFLKVIAPIAEAQLIETAVLNMINHQSLIATKAARVCHAAKGDRVLEFGLRRAQGPDAGIYGARAAIIAGCVGTSNVLAGREFDVPISGTHAHSWVMSFPDELTAFRTYAKYYPNSCILLVDTYNTLRSGVPNAIRVFQEMRDAGIPLKNYGIRLDSGDLAYLSKAAKEMLDNAGFTDAIISASNDLDEELIANLKQQGAKINAWGVGTRMITSADWSSFGGVYKLSGLLRPDHSYIPKIKISENVAKITNPGNKTIFRFYDNTSGKMIADLIALADETFDTSKDIVLFDPDNTWKRTALTGGTYSVKELLVPVFQKGRCVYQSPDIMEIQAHFFCELDTLWEESKRLTKPHKVFVDLSQKLYDLKHSLIQNATSDTK